MNKKVCVLQQENEEIKWKYINAQKQVQMLWDIIGEQQERNCCFVNGKNDYEKMVGFYQKQIEDANNTIIRLNSVIKTREYKNKALIDKCYMKV